MPSRQDVVDEARTWLGTPYRHQGRRKGHGVDCLGLISTIGKNLSVTSYDSLAYTRSPDGISLRKGCDKYMVSRETLAIGSVLLMWYAHRELPQHMAIVTRLPHGWGMVHALQSLGRVAEHSINDFWRKRIVQIYDLPGVE